jgi:hypothetical protein
MDIGDRVLYIANGEIDLQRDLGTILDFNEGPWGPTVAFDDGFIGAINKTELRRVVTRQESMAHHGYFGCLTDPCSLHSTKGKAG